VAVEAVARLAADLAAVSGRQVRLDEAGPHAPVDRRCTRFSDHERAQRAGRGRDRDGVVARFGDGRLEAELPKRLAGAFRRSLEAARTGELRLGGEIPAEAFAGLGQRLLGNDVHEVADEPVEVPRGELERRGLGWDAVELRRAPCTRPA